METNIALLPAETWQYLKAALRTGLGLTEGCQGLNLDVQAMSAFLARASDTLAQLRQQVATGYAEQLSMLLAAQNKGNAGQAKAIKQTLGSSFINAVTLWAEHCPADRADAGAVAAAFALYRHPQEVATACGLTRRDLVLRIHGDVNLSIYLTQAGYPVT